MVVDVKQRAGQKLFEVGVVPKRSHRDVLAFDGSDGEADVAADSRRISDVLPTVKDMSGVTFKTRPIRGQTGHHRQRWDGDMVGAVIRPIPQFALPLVDPQAGQCKCDCEDLGDANTTDQSKCDE